MIKYVGQLHSYQRYVIWSSLACLHSMSGILILCFCI